jgi:hypothetical protein
MCIYTFTYGDIRRSMCAYIWRKYAYVHFSVEYACQESIMYIYSVVCITNVYVAFFSERRLYMSMYRLRSTWVHTYIYYYSLSTYFRVALICIWIYKSKYVSMSRVCMHTISRSNYIYSSVHVHTFLDRGIYTLYSASRYYGPYISVLCKQVCTYTRYSFIRVCVHTLCIHHNRQNVEVAVICAHPPVQVVGEVLLLSAVLRHRGLAVGCRSSVPFMSGGSMKFRRSCNLSTK